MTSLPNVDDDPGSARQLVLTTYRVPQGGKNQYRNPGGHMEAVILLQEGHIYMLEKIRRRATELIPGLRDLSHEER